ncbi:MAG: N-formylglutamate amidohydrolase, partial [Deltaproteobacteria bacterium]|nr:N-formylglutamate amidohydrolase [Deltaproteobacteria bacterium]
MSRLPLLVSVPHAGTRIPEEVRELCMLTDYQVCRDGDEGASEIFAFRDTVEAWITSSVARAVVDLNRAEDDRDMDGVVKTHTCWDVPIYSAVLGDDLVEVLLQRYHRPYHRRLSRLADQAVRLGVDCHTMAAVAPPVAPEPGWDRPEVCLSNGEGTCPDQWVESLAECF